MIRKHLFSALSVLLLFGSIPVHAGAATTGTTTASSSSVTAQTYAPTVIDLYPEADAGVFKSNATRNYGTTNSFGLKNGFGEAYLRFDLSRLEGFPVTANVYMKTTSSSALYAPINIINIDDDTWVEGTKNNATASEGEITWNNKPKVGKEIVKDTFVVTPDNTLYPTTANQLVYADVTPSVIKEMNGNQKLSFSLQSTGGDYTNFSSREAASQANRPRLQVTVDRSYSFPARSLSVREGQSLTIPLNKQTMDGTDVTLAVYGLPNGAVFDPGAATITWTPNFSQAGVYPLTITASKQGLTASAKIVVTVADEPNAPEFVPLNNISAQEGSSVHFSVYATNPLGKALPYQAEGLPDGAVFNATTGEFDWTPSYRQSGAYNVVFSANNGAFVSKQNVKIDVKDINWPLLAPIEDQEVEQQQALKFLVQGWDPEGGTITYQASAVPYGATLDARTGVFRWVPEPDQTGYYTIGITATNGIAVSPVLPVNIAVVPKEDSDAKELYAKAEIGTKNGQFFKSAKEKLNQAISEADQVLSKPNASQDQINQAKASLKQAVEAFKSTVIKKPDGDLNNDNSINYEDLAELTANYGVESAADPSADVDGNGAIRLSDLVFVAKRVTQGDGLVKRTFNLLPDVDEYVTGGSSSGSSFDWLNELQIQNSGADDANTHEAFLKFNVSASQLPGVILHANFKMTLASTTDSVYGTPIATEFVANDQWDAYDWKQPNISYSNRPSSTPIYNGTATVVDGENGRKEYGIGVTGTILHEQSGNGSVTLRVNAAAQNGQLYRFISKEGGTTDEMPHLEVTSMVTTQTAAAYDNIESDLKDLQLGELTAVTSNLNFATLGAKGTNFKWTSSDEQIVTDQGVVTRPGAKLEDKSIYVNLTAVNGTITVKQRYRIIVLKDMQSAAPASADVAVTPVVVEDEVRGLIKDKWNNQFTDVNYPTQILTNVIEVNPEESIQNAIDTVSAQGGGVVYLKEGLHIINSPITIRSKVTLVGQGERNTIVKQGPNFTGTAFNGDTQTVQLTDIVFKDFTLEGTRGTSSNTGGENGIVFAGKDLVTAPHARIMLQRMTIKNWSGMGMHFKRVTDIIMDHVTSDYNGETNGLYHNLYFLYDNRILQSDSDFSRPARGKGAKYTSTQNVIAQRITIKDTLGNGIQSDNSGADHIIFHKYSITGAGGVAMWFPCENFSNKYVYTEDPTYAPQYVILSRVNLSHNRTGGIWRSVRNTYIVNSTFNNDRDDLQLLNSDVKFENTTFTHAPVYYTSVWDLPDPIL
ncbi:DUF7594 domain-containing protein [Paenibacillus rigui]|uniref:Probable pectate lyase C n=1 Tax=Paenibacillus rigui TaxID=554312 RepID=A0A229UUA0_9BACL|nr:putative Ig domain-containing protein [Paenibacillus rigui]OXM86923.1 hypothetical protein CF651_08750 [Paenibacillus rigui]